jgi:hypothetical protein
VRKNRALALIHFIEILLNHPERKVMVSLDGKDEAKPIDVCRGIRAVSGRSSPRRYELAILKETKLRGRKVRKLRCQLGKNLPNRQQVYATSGRARNALYPGAHEGDPEPSRPDREA